MQQKEKELNQTARVIPPHLNPVTMKKDVDPDSIKMGAKDALQYVSWLVNPNILYDVALTTYDFELVTLVATQTQKDPKEYVPYLQELKAMDETYMKFKIETDLKNYERALEVISLSDGHFEEAMALVKKQRLFKQALVLYESKPQLHIQVKRAFGDYLMTRGYVQEAGFLYMSSDAVEDIEKSLTAFKKGANVEMCISIAYKLDFSQEDLTKLNYELVDILASSHSYKNAADLLCSLENYPRAKAVEYYNKGNQFFSAIREAMKEKDLEIRASHLQATKNSVNLAYDVKKNQILKILEDFDKRYLRLKIVQNNKRNMPEFTLNKDGLGFDADQMSMSGASSYSESQLSSTSGRSGLSGYSETSKKSWRDKKNDKKKKKTMRKKRQVKEGSPFEEDNLIDMLKEETIISQEDKDQVRNIMNALVYFGMIEISTYLHSLVDRLMRAQKTC